MRILDRIHGHEDLVKLTDGERKILCEEIREFLVTQVSKTGGHLASNLGVVELTVALETVFDTSVDRLVFDVGHQSYVHKLLTGRQNQFDTLRQYGGMAGFPKPGESNCDAFVAGHASSSVSIALGMAKARTLMEQDYHVIALIGDGATTGGMAYEGMNNAGDSGEPMIVILNDNAMSIDSNVGAVAKHLSRIRSKSSYLNMKQALRKFSDHILGGKLFMHLLLNIKNLLKRILLRPTIFEDMGFVYLGPVNGADEKELISTLRSAKDLNKPVLLHVATQKGRGYLPAEEDPERFHGIGKFDPLTGKACSVKKKTYSDAFGTKMVELASSNSKICAITAAMPGGTGLKSFKEKFPERTFDVGIAEEHAVSMAGGLAKQGMIPVVAIYSTFLQRAYDMILQDVAILHLHVIFAIDRAGLVGEDGETHHGIFDLGFLLQTPGMMVLSPGSGEELQDMLQWSIDKYDGPVAIRYPRGSDRIDIGSGWQYNRDMELIHSVCHKHGNDVILITYGSLLTNAMDAAQILHEQGIEATVVRLMTIYPVPIDEVAEYMENNSRAVLLEEVHHGSGIYEALSCALFRRIPGCHVDVIDLGENFVTHGSMEALYRACGLEASQIADYVQEVMKNEN